MAVPPTLFLYDHHHCESSPLENFSSEKPGKDKKRMKVIIILCIAFLLLGLPLGKYSSVVQSEDDDGPLPLQHPHFVWTLQGKRWSGGPLCLWSSIPNTCVDLGCYTSGGICVNYGYPPNNNDCRCAMRNFRLNLNFRTTPGGNYTSVNMMIAGPQGCLLVNTKPFHHHSLFLEGWTSYRL